MSATGIFLVFLLFAAGVAGALVYGRSRWAARTRDIRSRLQSARLPKVPATYGASEVEGLPSPVRRYFRAVLQDGQPLVAGVRLLQDGEFRQGNAEDGWRPFQATQVFTTRPPGFDWDARIRMAPGIAAFVHDAYAAGEGLLHAEALGLIRVADVRGSGGAAQGELLRYLSEAVWFPTALLPSQGVQWEAIDDGAARATLTDGSTTVALDFAFDPEGWIRSFRAASRYRDEKDGISQFAPWHGRFWAHEVRDGMRIPLAGEVAWELPAGRVPYCRVRIREIAYEFAR